MSVDTEYEADLFVPTDAAHVFDEYDGIPEGWAAWVTYDDEGIGSPHEDDDGKVKFVCEGNKYNYMDCATLRSILNHADDMGWDETNIRGQIEEKIAPLALERFDFGEYGQGTMWAYVERMTPAQLLGDPKYWDAADWLKNAANLEAYAKDMLDNHIDVFKMWDDCGYVAVHVVNLATGEQEALWGVLDEYPYDHCKSQALEMCQ